MSSIATDPTNDVGSVIALLWAVVFAMTNFSTVLASLILIITEGTVECSKFTELVALKFVLSFWNGRSLPYVSTRRWTYKI